MHRDCGTWSYQSVHVGQTSRPSNGVLWRSETLKKKKREKEAMGTAYGILHGHGIFKKTSTMMNRLAERDGARIARKTIYALKTLAMIVAL